MKKPWKNQKASRTRLEKEGMNILKSVHTHDTRFGTHVISATSKTGGGKTSILLSFASYNLEHYPNEKTFFSECYNTPIQTFKLGSKDKVLFLIPKGGEHLVQFRNRDKHLEVVPHETFNVVYYNDYQDLYDKAAFDKINVPIFIDRKEIMEFTTWLRGLNTFVNIYIDEASEVAPSFQPTSIWRRISKFADTCKDARKCYITIAMTSQNVAQIDWRVRAIVDVKIFGVGARADRHCRVVQKAIDNLLEDKINGSEFFISEGSIFGLFQLTDIFEPVEGLNYEINITGKANQTDV